MAGTALWAIALYWGLSSLAHRTLAVFERWLGGGTPVASLLGMVPFLLVGGLLHYSLTLTLGASWAVSLGVIAAIGCGVYELGRQDSQASE